jgi:hypothetical protein
VLVKDCLAQQQERLKADQWKDRNFHCFFLELFGNANALDYRWCSANNLQHNLMRSRRNRSNPTHPKLPSTDLSASGQTSLLLFSFNRPKTRHSTDDVSIRYPSTASTFSSLLLRVLLRLSKRKHDNNIVTGSTVQIWIQIDIYGNS